MDNSDRVRIKRVQTLSDDWYLLKKTTFDYQGRNGSWTTLTRETYDRGNGSTLLLFNGKRGTVLLTRQFRFPVHKVLEAYMSPGSVTEKLFFFIGEYETRVTDSAGNFHEGEEIEVLELTLAEALEWIGDGRIQDGKTIILLLLAAKRRTIDAPILPA
jgi:hypothetical protein